MSSYFLSKLFEMNYMIQIHEGNANNRLAREYMKLLKEKKK